MEGGGEEESGITLLPTLTQNQCGGNSAAWFLFSLLLSFRPFQYFYREVSDKRVKRTAKAWF